MKFQVNARIEKVLWTNQTAWLYQVTDTESNKQKKWTVFTDRELNIGSDYLLSGYLSESKDKKLKDENQKDIWRTTFNVTEAKNTDGTASESANEADFPF
jgi:hypothetical protein